MALTKKIAMREAGLPTLDDAIAYYKDDNNMPLKGFAMTLRDPRARLSDAPPARPPVTGAPASDAVTSPVTRRERYLPGGSAERKNFPLCSGLLDYFPDACAAVAEVSYWGNEKHNPGQPLHWARGKSMDHADCIARHLIERGGFDGKIRHSAALAWRALALLQEELEAEGLAGKPRNAREPT